MIRYYLKMHHKYIIVFFLTTVPLAFLAPYKSHVMQWIIDSKSPKEIPAILSLGALIFLSVFLLQLTGKNLFSKISTNISASLRNDLIQKLLARDMGEFSIEDHGRYLSNLTADVQAIQNEILLPLYNISLYGSMLFFTLILLWNINPVFFVTAVVMAIFPALLPKLFAHPLTNLRNSFSKENGKYTTVAKDILGGFETIRSFGADKEIIKQHDNASMQLSSKEYMYNKMVNLNDNLTSFVGHVAFFSFLAIGALLVLDGKITMGYLVTATNLINFTLQPVQIISQSISKIIGAKCIHQRLLKILTEHVDEKQINHDVDLNGDLLLENVSFSYPNVQEKTLQHCTYRFEFGKKYAIAGASGSGKSTLAKLLTCLYREYDGTISYGGTDIQAISSSSYARIIAMIPQRVFLFNGSIADNITLFSHCWDDNEILAIAEKAGLSDLISKLPNGIHTTILDNNLSGGQAQRIGIARALIREPKILIADESTSSLDNKLANDREQTLLSYNGTSIIISHRQSTAMWEHVDKVLHMDHGRLL